MKETILLLCFILNTCFLFAQTNEQSPGSSPVADELVDGFQCEVQPAYRFRKDGKPGREIILSLKGKKLFGEAKVEIRTGGKKEVTDIAPLADGRSEFSVLLPDGVGVRQDAEVILSLRQASRVLKKNVTVPAFRHWTVYIYPHSHVDVGYTNTQDNVEILHMRNVEEGIRLGEQTRDYPDGARSRWNPEVTWPLERYWRRLSPERKERVAKAIQEGYLCIDASYLNVYTSVSSDEELFHLFSSK